jgi:predicted dinucleotide-binding enzyme
MKIGILGTGHIGKTLVRKLSAAGHDVKVANSRGPDTIEADVLAFGGRGVTAAEAVVDVDVIILSIPLNRLPGITSLIATVPAKTVVIDTSNYYPHRDAACCTDAQDYHRQNPTNSTSYSANDFASQS